VTGLFIAEGGVREGLGFGRGGDQNGTGGVRLLQVSWMEVEGDPDGRALLVSGRRS
jgi:hypothetical protein